MVSVAGFVSATGSAGTIGAGDYVKSKHPAARIVASEALQCPTLLRNGFGGHRIEGIGDKHIPWIHDLRATDEQMDFPVIYASAKDGYAKVDLQHVSGTMEPLFDTIVKHVPPPRAHAGEGFQLLVANLDYSDYLGRIAFGKIYTGKVVRITDFGAFVEIMPGTDGMVHISQLADYRAPTVESVVKLGDEVMVMVTDIDAGGKIRLTPRRSAV